MPNDTHLANEPATVYACWNADNEIIYIGSTVDLYRRLGEHECKSHWWPEVEDVQTFPMPTLTQARARERDAIASVRPDYNVAGVNRDRVGRLRRGGKRDSLGARREAASSS